MNQTVVVHQPDFIPYLGFFHRLLKSDIYIALDHVQFVRNTANAWTHRDKIKSRAGATWISLGVEKGHLGAAICDVQFRANNAWRESNLNLLRENYRRAPFFDTIFAGLKQVYEMPIAGMAAFNLAMLDVICEWLGIKVPRILSSSLSPRGQKSEMVADLVEKVGGKKYLSGVGARAYHQQEPFERRNVAVEWQDFHHPEYQQQFDGFVPYLSVVDALFNCGPEQTIQLLKKSL